MIINFITSNKGKASSLERFFCSVGRSDIKVNSLCLDIIEPQLDSVKDISKYKALAAVKMVDGMILVEDGGISIPALNGFPGVYSKYVIQTLKSDGILKLMVGETNRKAQFMSTASFVDENGKLHQFERQGGDFEISNDKVDIDSSYAWSDLWKIAYIKEFDKNLCEFSKQELDEYIEKSQAVGSLQNFAKWFISKY